MSRPADLEERLGYRFADKALLERALTHRSFGAAHNERLEFLGDGVLGCAIAHALYQRFPSLAEGKLTQMRAALIRREALAVVGERLGLAQSLRAGADVPLTESLVADAIEAIVGAVFVDGGYEAASRTAARLFQPLLEGVDPDAILKDAKTRLQELLQARRRKLPQYRIVSEQLSARSNLFEVECVLPDGDERASGRGSSRQRAEQDAAAEMLKSLQ